MLEARVDVEGVVRLAPLPGGDHARVLGVELNSAELLGVAVIGCGIISLVFVRNSEGLQNRQAALMALGTGVFIASYSLVDGLGARVAETALGFYVWMTTLNAALFALLIERVEPG